MKKPNHKQTKAMLSNFFEIRSAQMLNPLNMEKEPCSFVFFLN